MDSIQFVSCRETLQRVLSDIRSKRPGFYLRFGDGDYNLANGENDMLATATPSLQYWMRRAMSLSGESILLCMPHHCRELGTVEEGMCGGNHEVPISYIQKFIGTLYSLHQSLPKTIYTNVALGYCASHEPELVLEVHRELKKQYVLYIGNEMYSNDFLQKLFGAQVDTIYMNQRDAYFQHEHLFSNFERLYQEKYSFLDYFVVIMASGCAGRAFSAELHDRYFPRKQNFYVFDYGSLLDYLWGYKSRAYMDIDPPKADYILSHL
jgi:hypothetical protein